MERHGGVVEGAGHAWFHREFAVNCLLGLHTGVASPWIHGDLFTWASRPVNWSVRYGVVARCHGLGLSALGAFPSAPSGRVELAALPP